MKRTATCLAVAMAIAPQAYAQQGPDPNRPGAREVINYDVPDEVEIDYDVLDNIDTSTGQFGVVPLPDNVGATLTGLFTKYTKHVAPNGKPSRSTSSDSRASATSRWRAPARSSGTTWPTPLAPSTAAARPRWPTGWQTYARRSSTPTLRRGPSRCTTSSSRRSSLSRISTRPSHPSRATTSTCTTRRRPGSSSPGMPPTRRSCISYMPRRSRTCFPVTTRRSPAPRSARRRPGSTDTARTRRTNTSSADSTSTSASGITTRRGTAPPTVMSIPSIREPR